MKVDITRALRALSGFCCVLLLALASGCASDGPRIQTLGFLDDYAQLAPGRAGQASLIFINGEVDFSGYSAIVVDPVVAWAGPDGEPVPTTQELAKTLEEDLRRELALEFELVDQPRAGALRLRAALASEAGSHLVLEVEILDGGSGERVVAAVDHRQLETAGTPVQTNAWAILIRNRLASFRQFDAAARAREAEEGIR